MKTWDWLAYPERKRTKKTLAKNQPASANWWENIAPSCSDNSIRIFLKLAWFVTFMIQAYFRRVHLESWEQKGAYTFPPICTKGLISSNRTFSPCSFRLRYANQPHNFTNTVFVTSPLPIPFAGSRCHAIRNKNQNRSIDEVQNLGNERR